MKKHLLIIILLLCNTLIVFSPAKDNQVIEIVEIEDDDTLQVITEDYPDDIGYELIEDGQILHIWNTKDNYYFDVNSGIQLTNHYNQYWTHNVMMLGYYSGDTWNLLYRTDELSGFEKTIDTDDATYVNVTMWKDLSYDSYDFRFALVYYLELDDMELTVIPYIKNLGIDIPYILAFGWELKDIKIDMTEENDEFITEGEQYSLHQDLDESYDNTETDGYFYLVNNKSGNYNRDLYLKWDSDLTTLLKVKSRDGQYNAPVTLYIQIGNLAVGQEKFTKMYWHDSAYIIRPDSTGVINEFDYNGGSPSVNNWNRVDEAVSDGYTSYVSATANGQKDAYNFQEAVPRGTYGNAEVQDFFRADGVSGGTMRFVCYIDSTYYYSPVKTTTWHSTNFYYIDTDGCWSSNPSGGGWTREALNDAQFGFESHSGFYTYCTQFWVSCAYTPDTSAPTPNPMTWNLEPTTDSTTQISMSCIQASDSFYDDDELSYEFNETTGGTGATNSGWQLDDLTYTDSGLAENTNYTYHVRAKDGEPNEGSFSESSTTTTWANAPTDGEFTIDDYESTYINMSVLDVDNNETENLTGAYFECVTGGADGDRKSVV